MKKLIPQPFAKIPNSYVSIERNRGLSVLEEKQVCMLVNAMQKRWESTKKLEQIDFDFIANGSITIDEFMQVMQIGTDNKKQVHYALRDLVSFSLAICTNTSARMMPMFKEFYVEYTENLISYKFNDVFVEYFTGVCRDYFKLSIEEVIGLNSAHAIRIYQMLKTKQNMDKKDFEYTIDEIKKQLNINKKYSLYGDFKRYVLELSKSQINSSEASQFNIDYEEIKTGRAVTSIVFHILPKCKNYYQENKLLPNYQQDFIKKSCLANLKKYKPNDIVFILSQKVIEELKNKKPSLAVVRAYWDTICIHTEQKNILK